MKKEISVVFGMTVNLGNFESMRVQMGITRDLESGEDYEEELIKEAGKLRSLVYKEVSLNTKPSLEEDLEEEEKENLEGEEKNSIIIRRRKF